jgi:hypothetical protein
VGDSRTLHLAEPAEERVLHERRCRGDVQQQGDRRCFRKPHSDFDRAFEVRVDRENERRRVSSPLIETRDIAIE